MVVTIEYPQGDQTEIMPASPASPPRATSNVDCCVSMDDSKSSTMTVNASISTSKASRETPLMVDMASMVGNLRR
jgi:hypothetical protein